MLTLTTIRFVTRCKSGICPARQMPLTGDITVVINLHESVTGATYNGIARSEYDIAVLVRNFIAMIKDKYGLDSNQLRITLN